MTPDNSHTTAQLFKRIQQKKDEFSDTLLAITKAVAKMSWDALESTTERDRIINALGYWLAELASEGRETEAANFIAFLARHRSFLSNATHLADLGDGLTRLGYTPLASAAYTFAFTRSRGGGGWLSFGDANHIPWLKAAYQLSPDIALRTLAEEVGRYLDGSSYVYGITQHLVCALTALGLGQIATKMWWEAFKVIEYRLPRDLDDEGVFCKYHKTDHRLTIDESLILLLFARVSCPFQPTKVAATAGLATLCKAFPGRVVPALLVFLTMEPSSSTQLAILDLLLNFDSHPYPICHGIVDSLDRLAGIPSFGISEGARTLLHRIGRDAPGSSRPEPVSAPRVKKRKEMAIHSLDFGRRLELIKRIWPEFPSLVATQFDESWTASKSLNKSRAQSREQLAHSISRSSYPRAEILRWSHEAFETAFNQTLQTRPLSWNGPETDPAIAHYLLSRILPQIRTFVSHWHSRTVRPPLPPEFRQERQAITQLGDTDAYSGWVRCGLYEEQLILEGDAPFFECVGTVTATGGVVFRPGPQIDPNSLPFGVGHHETWWSDLTNPFRRNQPIFVGPLAGFCFAKSILGLQPLFVPHPVCFGCLVSRLAPQPGPFELLDSEGNPCLRFRWWKDGTLGEDLDESASKRRGCDLIIRNDLWRSIASSVEDPAIFELKVSQQRLVKPKRK